MTSDSELLLPACNLAHLPDTFRGWSAVDLCSGLGGLSIGADMLGVSVAGAMDTWDLATETVQENFPEAEVVQGSVTLKPERNRLAKQLGDIDLLMAGPPCQGFTQVQNGRRQQRDSRVAVVHGIKKACKEFRPRMFVIENVPAIANHHDGQFLLRLKDWLSRAGPGYHVGYGVVNAATFGVPQQRRRAFIVGLRRGEAAFSFPKATDLSAYIAAKRRRTPFNSFSKSADAILADEQDSRLVTVSQALNDLPDLEAGSSQAEANYRSVPNPFQKLMRRESSKATRIQTPRIQTDTIARLHLIEPGQCLQDVPRSKRGTLKRNHYSAYRRLHPDLPGTTLCTKIDCAYHHEKYRALSVREYARLQSIPDDYALPAVARHAYAMIGNAVPPLMLARFLAAGFTEGTD